MPLTAQEIWDVYVLQSRNVRELGVYRLQLLRDLNSSLVRSEKKSLETKTYLYALLFSAWSEAQFVQILHTPSAFLGTKIETILREKDSAGIGAGWKLMLAEAFAAVGDVATKRELEKKQEFVFEQIEEYVVKMAELRNKIAHGQWVVALNGKLTKENPATTARLQALDFVQIDVAFEVHTILGMIIRDLMQSPTKTHYRDFWKHHTELTQFINRTRHWSLATKLAQLQRKPRTQQSH